MLLFLGLSCAFYSIDEYVNHFKHYTAIFALKKNQQYSKNVERGDKYLLLGGRSLCYVPTTIFAPRFSPNYWNFCQQRQMAGDD